jgi:adenine nucleotide transporter 17
MAHALSGAVGSVLAVMLLYPIDTVKLLVQTANADTNAGFFTTLRKVIGGEGILRLYKGLTASVITESIHSFNYWVFHGLAFKYLASANDTSKTPASQRLLLNLVAKQLNWLCTVPFEVIAGTNQLDPGNPGFFATAVMLYRTGGIGTFYRGLVVSLVLAINPAIMNTMITSLLRGVAVFKKSIGFDRESAWDHGPATIGVATALSKFAATAATYPLIRAKVLQQTAKTGTSHLSMFAIWADIIKTEGPKGLYRGILAMTYKTVLHNALMMAFKHMLSPTRAITPPATPELRREEFMPPMTFIARDPFPADLCNAQKLDEILSYLKPGQREAVNKLEERLEGVAKELQQVHLLEGRLDHVSGELTQLKAMLATLVELQTKSRKNMPHGVHPACNLRCQA